MIEGEDEGRRCSNPLDRPLAARPFPATSMLRCCLGWTGWARPRRGSDRRGNRPRIFPYAPRRVVPASRRRRPGGGACASHSVGAVVPAGADPPDDDLSFKHALVQDAAYGSLLRAATRALHARIARSARAGIPGDRRGSQPELLTRHCAEGRTRREVGALSGGSRAAQVARALGRLSRPTAQLSRGGLNRLRH